MSTRRNCKRAEELSAPAVGEDEPIPGLTAGELTDPLPSSVNPQQSSEVFTQEHPGDQSTRAHGPQTVPVRVQSPIGMASAVGTSVPSQHQSRVAKALGTATQGRDSPWGIISGSDSGHSLGGAHNESDDHTSPDEGGTENEDSSFTIKAKDIHLNFQESAQRRHRHDVSPINTQQEPGIPESIERSRRSMGETQSIDMNALREEIKETISATIKEKLCSDADSVTTVSHSMTALDTNAQYWSNLSNKATYCSRRALELQLKMAEEKVNTLLYEEAPKEVLLEAAREAHNIHFQLDQNTRLCEAGLMSEQQVRFRTDPGGSVNHPSREYGVNPIHEAHIAQQEADAPLPRQSTPALSMTAQLDSVVVNRMSEYSSIQQMVRQAIQNASHEAEPEKSFLAKAGVKMGNLPTYSGECNLKKFENWVASVLQFMSMHNLLGPRVGKVQLQFLGQCLTDEAQEWFYQKVEQFDQEIKHWDLESVIMGLQKWFMLTLSMNKVVVNYDTIMQGSMTMQQLHQELMKLAKQMIELLDGGGNVRVNPTYGKNPIKLGNTVNKPTQINPVQTAPKANNTVVCYNCNQPGHIQPNCPFPDKDRRVAGARIEEVILEEFEENVPHPEEQQDWEDQPERMINIIKDSGYNDRHRLYGINVREAETDLRVSAVVQTGGKEQPVYDHRYDHRARREA
ncbi:hypothetical protein M422DRAFT_270120 [Sphaerobolus stellatus SS14]|uniref:CCHC-type domain-containing protein n=1 Tax=Sphaerobolus stellatus (strain SS14) TaxID=990650 RepID=A0A0C9UTG3_SPHS4|nr:hypothetical protein M422DRAFT_270120 [Sphaerobolus stellatus SS14]